jgi:hypothetical protein
MYGFLLFLKNILLNVTGYLLRFINIEKCGQICHSISEIIFNFGIFSNYSKNLEKLARKLAKIWKNGEKVGISYIRNLSYYLYLIYLTNTAVL